MIDTHFKILLVRYTTYSDPEFPPTIYAIKYLEKILLKYCKYQVTV